MFIYNKANSECEFNNSIKELSIIILGENDFFGELGIFTGIRTNSAEVIDDLSVVSIKKNLFYNLIEDPNFLPFTNEILHVISKWIIRANKQMLSLATKDFNSESNIAFALNDLAVRTTEKNIPQLFNENCREVLIKPDINQKDLSLLAGLSAVKFNKNLKNMESKKILSLEKAKGRIVGYKITNRDAFSDLLI